MTTRFDLSRIARVAIKTIRDTQISIRDFIVADPDSAFQTVQQLGRRGKLLLQVDSYAEINTRLSLLRRLESYNLLTIGEESLRDESLDFSTVQNLVVLMDMVDGTDLLERGLSNWCSAMVFYYPPERRIIAAFVGIPEDGVYCATEGEGERPYKHRFHVHGTPRRVQVTGPSEVESIEAASLAFYGQQIPNFLSIYEYERNDTTYRREFVTRIRSLYKDFARERRKPGTRIYNLAGNPMMVKVIDGHKKIDAVFDLEGQAPHDVVPGAYIAQKAGAVFCDLAGNHIDLNHILLRPADSNSRIRYLLTSTERLSQELRQYLADAPQLHTICSGLQKSTLPERLKMFSSLRSIGKNN